MEYRIRAGILDQAAQVYSAQQQTKRRGQYPPKIYQFETKIWIKQEFHTSLDPDNRVLHRQNGHDTNHLYAGIHFYHNRKLIWEPKKG